MGRQDYKLSTVSFFFENTQEFPLTLRDCGFTLLKLMTLRVDSLLLEATYRK